MNKSRISFKVQIDFIKFGKQCRFYTQEPAYLGAGLMFIAYNLRRIGNILTGDVLKEYKTYRM